MFKDFAVDIRAQITKIKKDMKDDHALTNRRMNEHEHHELPPQSECRNPTPKF